MITLPILTTSLNTLLFRKVGRMYFLNLGVKGWISALCKSADPEYFKFLLYCLCCFEYSQVRFLLTMDRPSHLFHAFAKSPLEAKVSWWSSNLSPHPWASVMIVMPYASVYPFTPKSDQFRISPAASPEIWHQTVWRTWLFIAHSAERWLYYQSSLHTYTLFFFKLRECSLGVKGLIKLPKVEKPIVTHEPRVTRASHGETGLKAWFPLGGRCDRYGRSDSVSIWSLRSLNTFLSDRSDYMETML